MKTWSPLKHTWHHQGMWGKNFDKPYRVRFCEGCGQTETALGPVWIVREPGNGYHVLPADNPEYISRSS